MKKITKLLLVAAATLAMALSFTSCEALLGAVMGTNMTLEVKDNSTNSKVPVTVKFEEYSDTDGKLTGVSKTVTTTTNNGQTIAIKDYVKATNFYKVTIVNYNDTTVSIPTTKSTVADNYATFDSDGKYLCVAGNADYVITIQQSGTSATIYATMQK